MWTVSISGTPAPAIDRPVTSRVRPEAPGIVFPAVVSDPETTRRLQWEALGDDAGLADDVRMARLHAIVGYLADGQEARRIPADYEPALHLPRRRPEPRRRRRDLILDGLERLRDTAGD